MNKTFEKLDIKKVKNCWGSYSYMGYVNDKAYTECYDTVEKLQEQNDIFKDLEVISTESWDKISDDCKGIYSDYQGYLPHLKGFRTNLRLVDGATHLVFEHMHFVIVD